MHKHLLKILKILRLPILFVLRILSTIFIKPLRSPKLTRASRAVVAIVYLAVASGIFIIFDGSRAKAGTSDMQGPKSASASGDCTNDAGAGTVAWTNPGNAYASDDSYATASVNGTTSNYIKCVNYGFTIPTSATINGIVVAVERKASGTNDGGITDAAIRAVKGGTIGATDRSTATAYTTSDTSEDHGTSSDLWGTTWTPADINNATFGAAVAVKKVTAGTSLTASVDFVSVTVHYTISSDLELNGYRWFDNSTEVSVPSYGVTWGGSQGDTAYAIAQDSSDNLFVAGVTNSAITGLSNGVSDFSLVKYDSYGIEKWTKTWGSTGNEEAFDIAIDASDNIYLVGYTGSASFTSGSNDQVLQKYDSSGTELWTKTWGGDNSDIAYGVSLDASGNIYVVGHTSSTGFTAGGDDQTLVKYNSSGVEQWSKTWGGTSADNTRGIAVDSSGYIYVVGWSASSGITTGVNDQTLVKYDSNGAEVWSKVWGGGGSDYARNVALDALGNIYVVGYTASSGVTTGSDDQTLVKYNSSGVEQWSKVWGGTGSDIAHDISVGSSGEIYVAGSTASTGITFGGSTDQTLVKYNSSGVEQWSKVWGGASVDTAYGIVLDSFGSIFIVGDTNSTGLTRGNSDQTLLRYGSDGTISNCINCADRALSETDRALSETDRALSETDRALSETDRATSENNRDIPETLVVEGQMGGFLKTWGGSSNDNASDVAYDQSGNMYVVGSTASTGYTFGGSFDVSLVKYNSAGVEQWSKVWGGTGSDNGMAVELDSADNIFVAGFTTSAELVQGGTDQFLIKFDSSGVEQWSKTWGGTGGDFAYDLALDTSANIYVSGLTSSTDRSAGLDDQTLVKYNSSGVEQWSKTWGGSGSERAQSVSLDSVGNIYTAGRTDSSGITTGSNDQTLVKYNSTGVEQWSKVWGGTGNDYAFEVKAISSGEIIYVVGTTASADRTEGGNTSADQTLVKYNSSGVEQWSKTWGGTGLDTASDVEVDSSGNIYVAGDTYSTDRVAGSNDQTLVKYNSSGVEQWSKTWGYSTTDSASGIDLSSSGFIAVAGNISADQSLIQIDTNGISCSGVCTDRALSETDRALSETDRALSETDRALSEVRNNESPLAVDAGAKVGNPLNSVAQNATTTAPAQGVPFRLRLTTRVSTANLSRGDVGLKLQYALQSGVCDTAFTGETYSDVSASTPIAYYDNTGTTNRFAVLENANDPTTGSAKVPQQYAESAGFGVAKRVQPGNDGMWDVSLTTVNPAGSNTYCIRMVTFAGGLLTYGTIPSITIPNTKPSAPTLVAPANTATGVSTTPEFTLGATDSDSDYLRYKIDVCSTSNCSSILRTIDQTSSQTGWLDQDQQLTTAYTGAPASITTYARHQYQLPALEYSTQYWWRGYAIDPGGTNTWSDASTIWSFTTGSAPPASVNITSGTNITSGSKISP